MKLLEGLFTHSVLQRSSGNICDAMFNGECEHSGVVKVYIASDQKAIDGFNPLCAGVAENNRFYGNIKGLTVGGPYDIKITIENQFLKILESIHITDILVGDVWILAGQSNMEGNGYIKNALKPMPFVHACYLDDNWDLAKDPLHFMGDAVDQVHIDLCGGVRPEKGSHVGTGPGVAFAQEMYRMTGVPQGLIACAHGGTSMSQWDPSLKELGGKSLYGAMIRRFIKNGGNIAGVLWFQGCNDTNPEAIPHYTDRMIEFVKCMKTDMKMDKLPIVAIQLSRVCFPTASGTDWNAIQEQQRLLPDKIDSFLTVPSIDLSLDDWIHIGGVDHKRLGIRCAKAMMVMMNHSSDFKPPITLKDIELQKNPISGSINIIVTFDNVMGKLQAKGRPSGFELAEKRNELMCHSIYRIDIKNNKVILKTCFNFMGDAESQFLYYGFGVQPYCNITDSADRSLPVIGPVIVGNAKAFSTATAADVSKALTFEGSIDSLPYPKDMRELEFSNRNFNYMFLNTHDVLEKGIVKDIMLYYLIKIECEEKMDLDIYLGYDGPVKMWVDRKEIYIDSNGINPAMPDDYKIGFNAEQGQHEILVALGSNNGCAWGIFLRFERKDIPLELLKMGPGYFKVPKFI